MFFLNRQFFKFKKIIVLLDNMLRNFLSVGVILLVSQAESTRYSYNSSDLSYLSNGIQFPVPPSESQNIMAEDPSYLDHVSVIRWLSGLYDHLKWGRLIKVLNNTKCRDDMTTYLEELQNGTSWATKSQ